MSYDLQFVDSIGASPTVRLDLMAAPWGVQDGTTFGVPELRRSAVSTLLADGERYPAAAYENRFVTLVARVVDVGEDAAASALQALYRELDRPGNILRYRPGTSEAVFFRTFRAGPDSVVWDPFVREVRAVVPAEPFAYGERQTLSTSTVTNNPASGCYFDVTGVKGDVETPLYLSITGPDVAQQPSAGALMSAISVRRRGNPSSAPFVLQAESLTMGTDTTVQANDAAMSGSGSNYVRTTFSTNASMVTRVQTSASPVWPTTGGVDVRGTYRVYCRYRHSADTGASMNMRLVWGGDNTTITNDTVALVEMDGGGGGPLLKYADLDLVQFPPGFDPVTDGQTGDEIGAAGMYFGVEAERTSGTVSLDIDVLVFLPADDRSLLVEWPTATTITASSVVLDSARGQVYGVDSSGYVVAMPSAKLAGLPPMVSPGETNRVYFMRDVGTATSINAGLGDTITATTGITPYYWPRYIYVRGVGS